MVVTLDEMKKYLRVDFDDDDVLLRNIMESALLRKNLVPGLQSCMRLPICMNTGKRQTIMH